MRMNIWKRILCALAGLLLMLFSVMVVLFGTGLMKVNPELPAEFWKRAALIGGGVISFALGLFCVSLLFRPSGKGRGFVIQSTEYGDMSISMRALENMVQHCTDKHKNLTAQHIGMRRTRDGVAVDLKVQLQSGSSIPQIISALQKDIKQYIGDASGVPVSEVRVMVETKQPRKGRGKVLDLDTAPVAAPEKEAKQPEQPAAETAAPEDEPVGDPEPANAETDAFTADAESEQPEDAGFPAEDADEAEADVLSAEEEEAQ